MIITAPASNQSTAFNHFCEENYKHCHSLLVFIENPAKIYITYRESATMSIIRYSYDSKWRQLLSKVQFKVALVLYRPRRECYRHSEMAGMCGEKMNHRAKRIVSLRQSVEIIKEEQSRGEDKITNRNLRELVK